MALFINGTRDWTTLAVNHSDLPVLHGRGSHELSISPQGIGGEVVVQLREAECHWSILSSAHTDIDIDGALEGLLSRVRASPNTRNGMVKYFGEKPLMLGVWIVLPVPAFTQVQRLAEILITSELVSYTIVVDMTGFRVPEAQVDVPTPQEFMSGRPYFFDDVSFTLRSKKLDVEKSACR